jgi:hypothetical protein
MRLQVIDAECAETTHLMVFRVLQNARKWLIRKRKLAVLMVCSGNIRCAYERAACVALPCPLCPRYSPFEHVAHRCCPQAFPLAGRAELFALSQLGFFYLPQLKPSFVELFYGGLVFWEAPNVPVLLQALLLSVPNKLCLPFFV